ncbi:MAG: hypothetical protein GT598_15580 [Bacteroidales bacterium]|nr:hypothetical protein [Bacteroidales bacterium]
MTPSKLAVLVKETLMKKPNKGVQFKSFANAMGDDYIDFVKYSNKAVEAVKAKRIAILEAEIEKIKKM